MMKKRSIAAACIAIAGLSACTSNISPTSYSVGSVGQVNRTVAAKVISVRPVDIAGTSGTGGAAGGALGATAGSGIGHGDRANVAGAIAGAVVGAVAGAAIEQGATRQSGFEYVVQTENDNLMTIVQGANPTFVVNDKVLVLYGSPARIIPDPRK
jgi:outer membrane lipoprotein SlyB